MGEMPWLTLPLGYQQFLPAPPAASFPSSPTIRLFCLSFALIGDDCCLPAPFRRGLRKGAQAFFGVWPCSHHAAHAVTSGRNLFNRLVWHAVIGAYCLFDGYLSTIAYAPAACGVVGRRNARILHCRPRAGRGLFAMAERHADKCKRRCGLLKPLGWAQQKGGKGAGEIAQA